MRPTPVGGLDFVRAAHKTPHGRIESEWTNKAGRFDWIIRVPVNTTATVFIPATSLKTITESGKPVRKATGVRYLRTKGSSAAFEVESGMYHFSAVLPK
jgi:alpha-L-rhamnosidase